MYPHFGQRIFLPHEKKVPPPRCGVALCHRPVDGIVSHTRSGKIKVRPKETGGQPGPCDRHRPEGGRRNDPDRNDCHYRPNSSIVRRSLDLPWQTRGAPPTREPDPIMTTVLLCSLIFLLSGLIQGLTGFGGGLMAIPLLCLIMDVRMAVPLCIVGKRTGHHHGHGLRTAAPVRVAQNPAPARRLTAGGSCRHGAAQGEMDPVLINRFLGFMLISISTFNLVPPRGP